MHCIAKSFESICFCSRAHTQREEHIVLRLISLFFLILLYADTVIATALSARVTEIEWENKLLEIFSRWQHV